MAPPLGWVSCYTMAFSSTRTDTSKPHRLHPHCQPYDDCCVAFPRGARSYQYVFAREGLDEYNTDSSVALEVYFSRTLGFTLLSLGILTVLLTGSVPLSSSLAEGSVLASRSILTSSNICRRINRKHRPQSALRSPHADDNGHLPLCVCLLLLRHVDRDGRYVV